MFQTPEVPLPETPDPLVDITSALTGDGDSLKKLSESIDVVGSAGNTPTVSWISLHHVREEGMQWLSW